MNVTELIKVLTTIERRFPNAPVRVEGWNDSGDLTDIQLRGDVRLGRDAVGNPVIILR